MDKWGSSDWIAAVWGLAFLPIPIALTALLCLVLVTHPEYAPFYFSFLYGGLLPLVAVAVFLRPGPDVD